MLTLYYAGATFLQGWRIKNVCHKISEQLALQGSISFYTLPAANEDGFDISLATSDRCVNRNGAKVSQILWLHGNQRGCSLLPMQTIQTSPWITFPEMPAQENDNAATPSSNWVPFSHGVTAEQVVQRLAERKDVVHLLLEMEAQPDLDVDKFADVLKIEDYGKPLAWKLDSHLAVLVATDVEHFTKFLIQTFLQNNRHINEQLPLIRIESISLEGQPQSYAQVAQHTRKISRPDGRLLQADEWTRHLEELRALCVFAHQANEYENKRQRTEERKSAAAAAAMKPDLLVHSSESEFAMTGTADEIDGASKGAENGSAADSASPMSVVVDVDGGGGQTPTLEKIVALAKVADIAATAAAVVAMAPSLAEKTVQVLPAETLQVTAVASAAPIEASPNKMKAKPTSIRRPTAVGDKKPPASSLETKTTKPIATGPAPIQPVKTSEEATPTLAASQAIPAPILSKQSAVSASPVSSSSICSSPRAGTTSTRLSDATTESSLARPSVVAAAPTPPSSAPVIAPSPPQPDKPMTPTTKPTPTLGSSTPSAVVEASVASPSGLSASTSAPAKRPSLRRNKDSLRDSKPLNILIYSDSASAREGVVATLKEILEADTYTVYAMTPQQVQQKYWLENTALLVVCGPVAPPQLGQVLVDYFLHGGKVLSLCSDILNFVLPNYRTAEVREHELVQFSYDKWQKVRMMHHIFCYQPSPVRKHFSTDSEDSNHMQARKSALLCPRSIELKDLQGAPHSLEVRVLGTEETWNTPSLLLANSLKSGGKAVFSQIHLETAPNEYETDEFKYPILRQNEKFRLEIFTDLLGKHLDINVRPANGQMDVSPSKRQVYQNAYFLGTYESKAELLAKLKEKTGNADNLITTTKLTMKFCGKKETPPHANTNVLPILIHSCPEDFSTVQYFENLKTKSIGRLVIYAPVVSSSMNVIEELDLVHGIAVLPRQQTDGVGRSNNQWLSPLGCAMFSIQLHISMDSALGGRLPLIQHIVGAAMVNALRRHRDYQNLDIALKWPNDIYANGLSKIGGLIVKTSLLGKMAIINIGCGLNLDNSKPTQCINDMITEFNRSHHQNIPPLKYEHLIALIFNEIEKIIDDIQKADDFEDFYKLYYDLWLHKNQSINICDQDGTQKNAVVEGIDDYGYLKVKLSSGIIQTVQPDGNSFDMLKGLIIPKFN